MIENNNEQLNTDNKGCLTLSEYANSRHATKSINTMNASQKAMINTLIEAGYINEVKHTYTTLFNGFSASTTYGQFKKLERAGLDIKVALSEAYSEPEYKTLSTDKETNSGSGTVTNFVNVYETGIFNSSSIGYDGNNTSVAILDSGFDVHHTVFQNMPDTSKLTFSPPHRDLFEYTWKLLLPDKPIKL